MQIIEMVKVYGIDYFDSALLSLDNFISRGTERFLENPDYLTSLNGVSFEPSICRCQDAGCCAFQKVELQPTYERPSGLCLSSSSCCGQVSKCKHACPCVVITDVERTPFSCYFRKPWHV